MHRVGTRLLQQYTGQQSVCPSPVNVNDSMPCHRASALNTQRHIRSNSGADNELASFKTAVTNVQLIRIAHSRRRKMRSRYAWKRRKHAKNVHLFCSTIWQMKPVYDK